MGDVVHWFRRMVRPERWNLAAQVRWATRSGAATRTAAAPGRMEPPYGLMRIELIAASAAVRSAAGVAA